jgi:DNA-binding PadR family transcriptional regulator
VAFEGGELGTEDVGTHHALGVGADREQPVADRAQQFDRTALRVHDKHLPHSEVSIEVDLLVGLITLRADLDDQLCPLGPALRLLLGTAIQLVRHAVVVCRAEQPSLIGGGQPLTFSQRCEHPDQLRAQPLMWTSGWRHHVQDRIPHLIAPVESQPAALSEHRLGNFEQYGLHTDRLLTGVPANRYLTGRPTPHTLSGVSSTQLLVLGVVRKSEPVHGYDVRRTLLTWRADEWANINPGSTYHALKTLTRDGFLRVADTSRRGSRPERTAYELTPEGEMAFFAMLRDALWQVSGYALPLYAGLAFVTALRREEALALLRNRIAQLDAGRESLRFVDTRGLAAGHAELLALKDETVEAEARWARAFIGRIEAGEYRFAGEPQPAASANI